MSALRAEIASALRKVGQQDSAYQAPPAAVFWPDPDLAWQGAIDQIREALPLLTLGDYQPDAAQGPAIWIRAVIADPAAPAISLPDRLAAHDERHPWVIYLPGYGRDAFGDLARLDPQLAPLADLQLRSRWWLQGNQLPWTPHAYLRTRDGIRLDLARDDATRIAVTTVLPTLLDQDVESLRRGSRWDAARLNALLVPDDVVEILQWLDDPGRVRSRLTDRGSWAAFTGVCRDTYGIDPDRDSQITAAHRLRRREGPWRQVWERFAEAPERYPGIPEVLDRAAPEALFGDDPHPDSRPAWNAEQEQELRAALSGLPASATDLPTTIAELERSHGARRNSVWARLGEAPLADALRWLSQLADEVKEPAPSTELGAVTQWYADRGHRIDDCAVRAIAAAPSAADRSAVLDTLAVLYDPWLGETADCFQRAAQDGYQGATGLSVEPGICVVFVDGLRLDLGHRLVDALADAALDATLTYRLAAFPTVTPCGQPAVAPLTVRVAGGPGMAAGDSQGRAMIGQIFRDALVASGVGYLPIGDLGDPAGIAWTQSNDIDALGHAHDHKLADRLDHELKLVAERVESLLAAGWRRVVIVTDHGFLLPARAAVKAELPLHLTEGDTSRKPRAARLKAGQTSDYPTLPWTWDPTVTMVSAPRAGAFVAGTLYEHGGLSPQECVIPVITVGRTSAAQEARIEGLRWSGQRCRVDVVPTSASVTVELRFAAGDGTTRVGQPKPAVDGEAKILISEEEAAEGSAVVVVLLDDSGTVIGQKSTTVGGT